MMCSAFKTSFQVKGEGLRDVFEHPFPPLELVLLIF